MNVLIKNGHILDPSQGIDESGDIFIENGKIKDVKTRSTQRRAERTEQKSKSEDMDIRTIDASGLLIVPGLIDMHVHLREPGYEYKETIRTGTLAAVRGGFTTVCCMPNTNPVNDHASVTEFIIRKAKQEGHCTVHPIGAITKGQRGEELAEIGTMKNEGCVAFSDDGQPVMNSTMMRRALEYSKAFNVPVISHSEDLTLSEGGVMNEGLISVTLGLRGIPAEAEQIMIFRDILLAELTGGRLHIAHVSTAGSVNIVRDAKKRGINVTAETCPHYFSITEDAVKGYNANAKVNPPLRTGRDVEAIKEGLRDGAIDVIATDHAPHHVDEKSRPFDMAPFGISGLETALSLSLELVKEGVLTKKQLFEKMTSNPAGILGLDKGALRAGSEAELVVIDESKEWEVKAGQFVSKGKNTPFEGWLLKGMPILTFSKGKLYEW